MFLENIKIALVGFVGAMLLKTVHATLRWTNLGELVEPERCATGGPFIIALWHGQQLFISFIPGDFKFAKPVNVLISEHRDGRYIAKVVGWLGLRSIAGSSSRSARKATLALLKCLKSGEHIAITPDGPKGPIYKSKPGAIFLATRSGAAILPMACSFKNAFRFKSWDKMIFPVPFSRAVRIVGEPIVIPRDLEQEEIEVYQKRLDASLQQITNLADSFKY